MESVTSLSLCLAPGRLPLSLCQCGCRRNSLFWASRPGADVSKSCALESFGQHSAAAPAPHGLLGMSLSTCKEASLFFLK